jgi:hypothetical protein
MPLIREYECPLRRIACTAGHVNRKRLDTGACGPHPDTKSHYEHGRRRAASPVQARPRLSRCFQRPLVGPTELHAISILELDSMAIGRAARKGAGHGSTLRPPARARTSDPTDEARSRPLTGAGSQRRRSAPDLDLPHRGRQQPRFRNAEADRHIPRRQGLGDRPFGREDRRRRLARQRAEAVTYGAGGINDGRVVYGDGPRRDHDPQPGSRQEALLASPWSRDRRAILQMSPRATTTRSRFVGATPAPAIPARQCGSSELSARRPSVLRR